MEKTGFIKKSTNAELHLKEVDGSNCVCGYIATYGNVDSDGDVIKRGAFGELNPKKIKFLYQHDWHRVLGVAQTLFDDERGVYAEFKFADSGGNDLFSEVYSLVKMGALNSFSVGFQVEEFSRNSDGARVIEKAKLWEASIVTFPANGEAVVTSVKDIGKNCTKRDFEHGIRSLGFSQKESAIITSKAFPALEEHWEGAEMGQGELDCGNLNKSLNNLLEIIKKV